MYTHAYIHAYVVTSIYEYITMYVYKSNYKYTHAYIYIYVYIHIYTYIYIYRHHAHDLPNLQIVFHTGRPCMRCGCGISGPKNLRSKSRKTGPCRHTGFSLTPRLRPAYVSLRPKMVSNVSKAHPLRMRLRCDVMCYAHDVMCYDDGKLPMINIAYASLRHGLRQLTPIDACQCFQACNTQHNHTGNKPAVKGVY